MTGRVCDTQLPSCPLEVIKALGVGMWDRVIEGVPGRGGSPNKCLIMLIVPELVELRGRVEFEIHSHGYIQHQAFMHHSFFEMYLATYKTLTEKSEERIFFDW